MVTAVKDGSDGVASVIRGFGAGNEGKSAVKTLGKKTAVWGELHM